MTTLYLVRHGETKDNARHIMQGQTPGELNENGINQAIELGKELKNIHFDAFVSSDLRRSMHTCKLIAEAQNATNITTTPLLRERDWGSFTGKYIPDLSNLSDPSLWPKDIEPLEKMKDRAEDFLQWILKRYPNQTVLAVGHGIINKAIRSVFHDKPMQEIPPMKNCEVQILRLG